MIIFRKAKLGDERGISQLFKTGLKRKAWKYNGTTSYPKEKMINLRKKLTDKKATSIIFIAIDSKNKKIIGFMNYSFKKNSRLRHRIDLGWGVHPDYMNQGIGTLLLKLALRNAKKKGFKRAESEMAIKNIASWKMAKKCGFKIEGIKRKALLTDDGKYIDTYIVGKML